MASVETGEQPKRDWHRRTRRAPEIEEDIKRRVSFVLASVPPRKELLKMARYGTHQIQSIGGAIWEIWVENYRVGHDLGMGNPRTRSIVMREEYVEYRLSTDWQMRQGIGFLTRLLGRLPGKMSSLELDPFPLGL